MWEQEDQGPQEPPAPAARQRPEQLPRAAQLRALQATAGNSALATLLRAPTAAPPAPHHHAAEKEDPNSYVDFLNTVGDFSEAAFAKHGSGLVDVRVGARVSQRQRALLESMRAALVLAYTPAAGSSQLALAQWEILSPDVSPVLVHSGELGVPASDLAVIRQQLNDMSEKLIRPAAYWDAHREARAGSDLKAPDLVFEQERLERVETEFKAAEALAEETTKLTGIAAMNAALSAERAPLGKDIVELVHLPGTIEEKLEWAKKNGVLGYAATGADLTSKIGGGVGTIVNVSFTISRQYSLGMAARAAERGAEQLAEHWKEVAKVWGERIEKVESVGRVFAWLGAIADGIKTIRAILRGDWEEAVSQGASTAADIASILAEPEAAPLLGAILIVIKAEIEVFSLAAAFIRWCKDEAVREAAGSFIEACDTVAKNAAFDFVADVELLLDPSHAGISDIVSKQLVAHTAVMQQSMAYLGSHLNATGHGTRLGDHPQLVAQLGDKAQHALGLHIDTPDDPLTLAEQIRDVFVGANAMARYVRTAYPTAPPAATEE